MPDSEDPAVAAFSALQGEVAEVVTAVSGLQAHLTALRGGLDELRQRQAPATPDYNRTLGVLAKTLAEVGSRVDAVAAAVNERVGVLAQDLAQTRLVVRDAATATRGAAAQGLEAVREAAEHAGGVREALLSDRTTMVLILVALLVMGGLGLGSGWGLRGWWAPPPAGVFAHYLAAGNDPDWLLCEGGGKRFTAQNDAAACELKFWLGKPDRRARESVLGR